MNEQTMLLNADPLILSALREDISSENVTTNAVMKTSVPGEVEQESLSDPRMNCV